MGLNVYHPESLFDASLFVTIRKRMGLQEFDKMKTIMGQLMGEAIKESNTGLPKNKGELKLDVTVSYHRLMSTIAQSSHKGILHLKTKWSLFCLRSVSHLSDGASFASNHGHYQLFSEIKLY